MARSRPSVTEQKRRAACSALARHGGVLVALSGGVDSAVLLILAVEALGPDRVVAMTARSASLPAADLEDARRVAARAGVRHEVVDTGELDREDYRANDTNRCFHCRDELFLEATRVARRLGLDGMTYGAIADDLGEQRPGMRAAERHGVIAPLLEAGFTKEDVRAVAAEAGLEVRDKPAAACLASRIPTGIPVTRERLEQIERAETALRGLGFGQLRVRHHGDVARIELDHEGDLRIRDPQLRASVVSAVRAAGYRFVALDLDGYRSGSVSANPPARDRGQ